MEKIKSKKGFTLVELIVVIVIIAILAAITVPALTGYIDKAQETQAMADAKTFQTAIQSIVVEAYATCQGDPVFGTISTSSLVRVGPWKNSESASVTTGKTYIDTASELTGIKFTEANFFNSPNEKRITFTPRYGSGQLLSFNYITNDKKIEIRYTQKDGFKRVK